MKANASGMSRRGDYDVSAARSLLYEPVHRWERRWVYPNDDAAQHLMVWKWMKREEEEEDGHVDKDEEEEEDDKKDDRQVDKKNVYGEAEEKRV